MRNFLRKHKITLIIALICVLLSSAFVLLFSYSTSPIQGDNFFGGFVNKDVGYDGDTTQFLTIGKSWAEGQVPYRDLFDHKGPIIFMVDALGYLMGGKVAICIIQIICLSFSLFFVYKICGLVTSKKWFVVLSWGLTLLTLLCTYTDGNSVQEYCLPFIFVATYFVCKFLLSNQKRHDYKIGFLYGICAGVCLMTQLNSAILIIAGIGVIVGILIKNKEFKNLYHNLLAGVLGILTICAPFMIYFICNNAFGDFFFATFIYNFEYAAQAKTWLNYIDINQIITFITAYFGFLCIFPTIFLAFTRKKYAYSIFLSLAAILEIFTFFTILLHQHYPMIVLPQVALFLNELYLVKRKNTTRFVVKIISILFIIIALYFQITHYLFAWLFKTKMIHDPQPVGYEQLIQNYIDDMSNTSVLVNGDRPVKDFYLKYNLSVPEKYFIIQGWHANYDPQVRQEIEDQFRNTSVKYILLDQNQWYYDLIKDRYTLLGNENGYSLYRLKQ